MMPALTEEQLAEIEALLVRTGHGPGQMDSGATLSALVALRNHATALIAGCREAARLREENARLSEFMRRLVDSEVRVTSYHEPACPSLPPRRTSADCPACQWALAWSEARTAIGLKPLEDGTIPASDKPANCKSMRRMVQCAALTDTLQFLLLKSANSLSSLLLQAKMSQKTCPA